MCGVRVKISPSSLLALQPPCGGVPSVLGPDDHCLNDPSYRLLGRHPPCRVEHPYASATVCMRYINMGIAAQRARAWLFRRYSLSLGVPCTCQPRARLSDWRQPRSFQPRSTSPGWHTHCSYLAGPSRNGPKPFLFSLSPLPGPRGISARDVRRTALSPTLFLCS